MVSIKDVARHAGVAISTVSKVLNNYPNVSEETKKRVNESVKELNFLPNSVDFPSNMEKKKVFTSSPSFAALLIAPDR